ncbi:hypothetical protein TVAG_094340 [Trichomonas vaginalis G3]|uniref:Uncharacterized protein n=1 Tax=Trichomonas vaginalis (strain ATCC PRA-98 / G3) TaxID=412133 RepID=A2DBQ6_TRIV3|nr:hypothetical protein TVAGG3_0380960 [Trichomonas vaginalis G3]EAY22259.1 hypothetical protein TVAG_094340 [Trichomonas vaginalis G3]KAI5533270.1 hypothetical protein TVAGG3_0380960 [Trichomonas vaginalis G3]|eukprot:XP_001583245.1 hypothetical protein [Trichomonas vaginalis G3]
MNEQNEAMNDLQDSTALVSRSIASAIAGLQLTNTTQIGSFFSISHCANNVSRLLSLQTGGIEVLSSRPLLMKRAQRAYLRTITKMFDLVEFTSEENISKLEKNKLNLIKSCFIPYRTLVTAISCRCEYRVPKIYYQVISGRFNDFDKEINEIKKFCDVLISSTGDLESADKMKEVFNSLCIQFKETSEKLTNKDEIISITSTITQFTLSSSSLLNALVHVENFFETSSTGDFSSASLLPSIFEMPDVSKQSKSIEKDMKKYEDNHNITSKALQDINVSKSRNESLAKSISDLCRKQSSNLESALCVSYHLNNFSGVSQITSTCQDIVIQMNVLLKNIRMKFLNIECTRTNESIIHSIKKLVDDLFEKTKSSYQKFLSSEKLRKKQLASFTKVISPLEESLANLTKLRSEIDKLPNGQTKVYSTKLYDISTNYLDGLVKVMKISRDHPSKTVEPSSLNDFSSASCQAAQSSATAIEDIISKKGGSEDRVINTMSLFVQLNDQVRSIKCAEELKLVDVVSATTKLSQLVIDSAKAARDVKLAAKKKKDGKGSSLKSKTESEEIGDISEESISRRLILESRVLKAHYIHDYLQKKLSQIK